MMQKIIIYISFLLILFSLGCNTNDSYKEAYRAQYHFSPMKNWMHVPSGLFYYDGEYHMYYQYNPYGIEWGHMSWGHAISPDLIHWEEQPVAISETDGEMVFCGSIVVDKDNTSGLGGGFHPPVVAIYTGSRIDNNRQYQCLAYSNDRAKTWHKYEFNPVLDIGSEHFRDPKVFWYNPDEKWVMVLTNADQQKLSFYSSQDLIRWTFMSEFVGEKQKGRLWDNPDFFAIPVNRDSTLKKWILKVDIGDQSIKQGMGGLCIVGDFDGEKFIPEQINYKENEAAWGIDYALKEKYYNVCWNDYGKDFRGAYSWSDIPDKDGRRIWIGWMNNWNYVNQIPNQKWKGVMSLPREVYLEKSAKGYEIIQNPVRETSKLRKGKVKIKFTTLDELNNSLTREMENCHSLEIHVVFDLTKEDHMSLVLFESVDQQLNFNYSKDKGYIEILRKVSDPNVLGDQFTSISDVQIGSQSQLKLDMFIDRTSVELFVNDGKYVATTRFFPKDYNIKIENLKSYTSIKDIEVYKMKSIWK